MSPWAANGAPEGCEEGPGLVGDVGEVVGEGCEERGVGQARVHQGVQEILAQLGRAPPKLHKGCHQAPNIRLLARTLSLGLTRGGKVYVCTGEVPLDGFREPRKEGGVQGQIPPQLMAPPPQRL